MKKEIEITFKDLRATLKENLIIGVYTSDEKVDEITLKKDKVSIGADNLVCFILGIKDCLSIEDYLKVPEIKALYDEHFKKEVDLFEFVEKTGKFFAVDIDASICEINVYHDKELNENAQLNFNAFPTKELAEKAKPMSLDERKQLLFANAKGYDVLTREEAVRMLNLVEETLSLYYDGIFKRHEIQREINVYTSNIYFANLDHAQECAVFMNETKEVQNER